jgi:hypothetical protein
MKFDKDTLLKHRFWFLLALAAPLSIVGLFLLGFSVRAQIDKEKKAIEDTLKKVKAYAKPESQESVDKAQKRATDKKSKQDVVWRLAAREQDRLMTWPKGVEDKYGFGNGLFAQQISATRKKEEAPADPGQAAKDSDSQFEGKIVQRNPNWIEVEGARQKKRFGRTNDVKVTFTDSDPGLKDADFNTLDVGDRVTVTFEKGKYFGDKLTDQERTDYARDYRTQLLPILERVTPLSDKGEGVVQFPGWVWNGRDLPPKNARFFHYVDSTEQGRAEWKQDQNISDEAWLAQEDLWIQDDIYRLVRLANDSVAIFQSKTDKKDGEQVFVNPYWELKCRVSGGKLKITMKNLLDQRQYPNVTFLFKVTQSGGWVRRPIEGDALAPAGMPKDHPKDTLEREFDAAGLGGVRPEGVYGIQQVLTWRTAAVKRIDAISIGNLALDDCASSHRQFYWPTELKLLPPKWWPKKAADTTAPDPTAAVATQPGGTRPGGRPPGGLRGGQTAPTDLTYNGLIFDRYVKMERELRQLPVAVVLIVDQQHVQRVQAAFAYSNLRFLTTQVIINRFPQSLRPQEGSTNPMAFARGAGGHQQVFGPGNWGPGRSHGGGTTSAAAAGDEVESNMELILYGDVTLYERFPPRASTAP